jgi:hypothetical protein
VTPEQRALLVLTARTVSTEPRATPEQREHKGRKGMLVPRVLLDLLVPLAPLVQRVTPEPPALLEPTVRTASMEPLARQAPRVTPEPLVPRAR